MYKRRDANFLPRILRRHVLTLRLRKSFFLSCSWRRPVTMLYSWCVIMRQKCDERKPFWKVTSLFPQKCEYNYIYSTYLHLAVWCTVSWQFEKCLIFLDKKFPSFPQKSQSFFSWSTFLFAKKDVDVIESVLFSMLFSLCMMVALEMGRWLNRQFWLSVWNPSLP